VEGIYAFRKAGMMAHFRFWNSADVLNFQFWEVRIHFSLDATTDMAADQTESL